MMAVQAAQGGCCGLSRLWSGLLDALVFCASDVSESRRGSGGVGDGVGGGGVGAAGAVIVVGCCGDWSDSICSSSWPQDVQPRGGKEHDSGKVKKLNEPNTNAKVIVPRNR